MSPAEVARLLAKASAFDRRTIGAAEVAVWHEVLAAVDFADGLEAVTRHHTQTDKWLMPVHVRRLAAQIRRERRDRIARAAQVRAIEAEQTEADRRPLRDRSPELQAFVGEVRGALPAGDPDSLRWGHKHWRQIRQRAQRAAQAEPNPHYDPAAVGRSEGTGT